MTTTVLDVLKKATTYFEERRLDSPRLDAEVLLAHGLSLRRIDLYLQHDRPLSEAELVPLRALVRERGRGMPVAYLVGEREFFALGFRVTKDVLVPRPETETLVATAIDALVGVPAPKFLDVGTGSGCVAVALLTSIAGSTAGATDVSDAALEVARANALRHGVDSRLDARRGSLLDPFRSDWGTFDAVVSNPPYVVRGDPALDAHVAAFEPASALYVPGDDPLSFVREISRASKSALKPGGFLAVEIGAPSGPAAKSLLETEGYLNVAVRRDLAGLDRVVHGRTPA